MKLLVVALALLVAVAYATEENHHHHPHHKHHHHHHHHKEHKDFKCRGEHVVHNEEFSKSKTECRKEIKVKEDDEDAEGRKSGRACITSCALAKVGALDTKGMIVESKIRQMIGSTFVNKDAKAEIENAVINCGKNATGLGFDHSDNRCSNYKSYFECSWKSITAACVDPSSHDQLE